MASFVATAKHKTGNPAAGSLPATAATSRTEMNKAYCVAPAHMPRHDQRHAVFFGEA